MSASTRKTALIVGCTGATGQHLTRMLLNSPTYQQIHIVHYRPTEFAGHPKVSEHILSLDAFESLDIQSPIDEIFCCLGTTLKRAGSVKAFAKVDRDYVLNTARWAVNQGARQFHVISSLGVSLRSPNYYSRTKAEMELELRKLPFEAIWIYRPSMLDATRHETRLAETLSMPVVRLLCCLPYLKRFRPLKVEDLAAAMQQQAQQSNKGVHEILSKDMQGAANSH